MMGIKLTGFSFIGGSTIAHGPSKPDLGLTERRIDSPSAAEFDDAPTSILQTLWETVSDIAARTPHLTPDQRKFLSEAYLTAKNAGTIEQVHTAGAVEQLFLLKSFLGDKKETPLAQQRLTAIMTALHEPDAADRREKLHTIFRFMESASDSTTDSMKSIKGLLKVGKDGETIAVRINRTHHTAFIDDIKIARAIVSLAIEEADFMGPLNARRDQNRSHLLARIQKRIDAHHPLTGDFFRELLKETGFEVPASVSILTKTTAEFNAKVDEWGEVVGSESPLGCRDTLFRRTKEGAKEIWVRTETDMTSKLIANRLMGIVHETEHSLQEIFDEITAGLAEIRWRLKNYDADCLIMAERMGLTIVQYLHAIESWAYQKPIST